MKNKNVEEKENVVEVPKGVLSKNAKGIKDLIAPAGIDFSNINHVEIVSTKTRYARSMIVANIPRMCTFPEFLRSMYTFGDVNTSVFISPVSESSSQTDLNRTINELEAERLVAIDRGDINRERILAQKRIEAEDTSLCFYYTVSQFYLSILILRNSLLSIFPAADIGYSVTKAIFRGTL